MFYNYAVCDYVQLQNVDEDARTTPKYYIIRTAYVMGDQKGVVEDPKKIHRYDQRTD